MDDLISRQAAVEKLNNIVDKDGFRDSSGYVRKSLVRFMLNNLPSAQPEQKHGKWIRFTYSSIYSWECSECNAYHRAIYNYCPTCGAKMEE